MATSCPGGEASSDCLDVGTAVVCVEVAGCALCVGRSGARRHHNVATRTTLRQPVLIRRTLVIRSPEGRLEDRAGNALSLHHRARRQIVMTIHPAARTSLSAAAVPTDQRKDIADVEGRRIGTLALHSVRTRRIQDNGGARNLASRVSRRAGVRIPPLAPMAVWLVIGHNISAHATGRRDLPESCNCLSSRWHSAHCARCTSTRTHSVRPSRPPR